MSWRSTSGGLVADHAAGVQERYVLGDGRVEHLFAIAERPAGAGALSLAADTNLTGPVLRRRQARQDWGGMRRYWDALLFTDRDGRGTIAYYGARAVDAAGRVEEIVPEWRPPPSSPLDRGGRHGVPFETGDSASPARRSPEKAGRGAGTIVLRVSAAFMAAARFPLRIDPWIELAGSAPREAGVSHGSAATDQPVVAVGAGDRVVVAWRQFTSGADQIFLKTWTGECWDELGGSASAGLASGALDRAEDPALALDSRGYPVVAWSEVELDTARVQVRRWDDAAWLELGSSRPGHGISDAVPAREGAMAVASGDRPIVAWRAEAEGIQNIYFRQWDGVEWAELAGSASGAGISGGATSAYEPAVAAAASGDPVVAWQGLSGGVGQVYLKTYSAGAWVELGGSATAGGISGTAGHSYAPALALDGGDRPWVAWVDVSPGNEEIYPKMWNGETWVELAGSTTGGGVSASADSSTVPAIAVGTDGGAALAWQETVSGAGEIYVRRWNGTAWEELSGSASGGGISDTSSESAAPAIAVDDAGQIFVAWTETVSGDEEILLRFWDGASWAELGGSASGGGISAAAGWSGQAALTLDAAGFDTRQKKAGPGHQNWAAARLLTGNKPPTS
ncbi:MAG: hypothetical protein HYV63_30625 [Candidatus Schekmanbacteria bacterium]|nr:hypothetical protein [Candidatus Schekmanbacteria bacterium]